jgi:hypothetical protein
VGITACSQNIVEGEENKNFFPKGEDLIVRFGLQFTSFLPWKTLFALSRPSGCRKQCGENTFAQKVFRKAFIKGMTTIFDKNEKNNNNNN